jgi:hypothetical protein
VIASNQARPGILSDRHPSNGLWRAALLAGVFVVVQAGTADAQFWYPYQYRYEFQDMRPRYRDDMRSPYRDDTRSREDRPRRSNRGEAKKKDTLVRHPFGESMQKGPLQLVVSINDQRATLYSNGVRVTDARVSTGVSGHPTPTGIFSVIQKNRWHRSNLYSSAPMYYMHRLTWSGIALHEGHLPGYPASHGCIRLPTDFVSRLWAVSKLGMRVVIARSDVRPEEISHPKLFNPAPKPADTAQVDTSNDLRPSVAASASNVVRVAEASAATAGATTVTDTARDGAGSVAPAQSAPAQAVAIVQAAAQAPATAIQAPADSSRTAQSAPAAPAANPTDGAGPAEGPSPEPQQPAIDPNDVTVPRPAPPRRAAERQNGQVAVFISRKEKRIFVRQAFVPVFDMPIEIADPEKPLGTHTYTALQVMDEGTRMRWNVISMPLTVTHPAVTNNKGASKQRAKNVRGAVVTRDSSNAIEALDRVAIPQEAVERISEMLTPGSSLVISDEGLGRETGRYTEFIVETR